MDWNHSCPLLVEGNHDLNPTTLSAVCNVVTGQSPAQRPLVLASELRATQ